jgi:hypothetical protein
MAEFYTIESADDSVPIDPRLLRELRDLLREDEDLDLGISLKDRAPARGEQGAIPVALEIIATAMPLGTAFAGVLKHWIDKNHGVSFKIGRKGGEPGFVVKGVSAKELERIIAQLQRGNGAQPGGGG